jgi:hypothetical protein
MAFYELWFISPAVLIQSLVAEVSQLRMEQQLGNADIIQTDPTLVQKLQDSTTALASTKQQLDELTLRY